jgi:hypothetical protein
MVTGRSSSSKVPNSPSPKRKAAVGHQKILQSFRPAGGEEGQLSSLLPVITLVGRRNFRAAILMLHLFVAPTPFEGWGEYPYDGTTVLLVIVSLGALTLTVCLALVMLLSGEPLELPDPNRFPIPACLTIAFAVWRDTRLCGAL